jgi:hypothetical protein
LKTALPPAVAPEIFPDPVLCASVYCSGRLCEVIDRLVAPFWHEYRVRSSVRSSYLWLMRYARCGEHLKIRLHAPESEAPLLRERLLSAVAEYFSLPAPPPDARRKSTPAAPPVDAGDWATTDYPDRTFLWTEYRRSHLSLGYRPYLDDDHYCALLTRCLGAGTEIVLDRLESGPNGECPYSLQREIWRDTLLAGLLATPFSARERALYLLYHRDCLLRFLRKRKRWTDGTVALAQVLSQFDRQRGRPELRKELASAMAESWNLCRPPQLGADLDAWCGALRAFSEYLSPLLGDPSCHVDPFADHAAFPLFFKVFHGLANQVGLDATNEAFLYHSLVDVAGEADLCHRPVRLRPEL